MELLISKFIDKGYPKEALIAFCVFAIFSVAISIDTESK